MKHRTPNRNPFTPEEQEQVLGLYKLGHRSPSISIKTGLTCSRVVRFLKAQGLTGTVKDAIDAKYASGILKKHSRYVKKGDRP